MNCRMATQCNSILPFIVMMFKLSSGELTVDRSKEGLTKIPDNINSGVTKLILNKNFITRIEENDTESLPLLERLFLNNNQVSFISTRAFINNIHLVLLSLYDHKLLTFPTEAGGARSHIEVIVTSIGRIKMQPIQLTNLPALMTIEINSNQIDNLSIGYLPSLTSLDAQWCGLVTFPDLSAAPALVRVAMGSNRFSEVPKSAVAGLNKLRYLYLTGCHIPYLPDLSHLVSLEVLKIDNNDLKSLPDLYDVPLTGFLWAENPLVCDRALCWLRMWSFMRPVLTMDNSPGKDVCEAPEHRNGLRVMDIHPVDMECYNGNRNQTFSPGSYNLHRLQHQWTEVIQMFEISVFSVFVFCGNTHYHKVSNITCPKFWNLSDYRPVLQLSLPNLLKPCVKSRMKM